MNSNELLGVSEHEIPRATEIAAPPIETPAQLLRQIGLFDATMIVMGGIVGAGIFINPYVFARQVHTPMLILAVIVLYLGVNFVCVQALGAEGLAASTVPASAVMRMAMGNTGARLIALGIAVSTLGFLSQSVLTAPRVYFAMARDVVFFEAVARISKKPHVPVFAIVMQSVLTLVIALSGSHEKILNYVASMDFIF